MSNLPIILSGNSNPGLAAHIANHSTLGITVGEATIGRFSDGEVKVEIGENVRGREVYVVQSTCAPADAHLMELLTMCDALKRASANSITAVVPYFGYARQDRKVAGRTPITAKLVMDMLTVAGASRILTMEIHSGQEQGFFNGPVDNLYGHPVFFRSLQEDMRGSAPTVIVSPDAGGVVRARGYAKRLGCELAIIDKRREAANTSEVMNVIGDVKGRTAILVDDMVDTAGTLVQGAEALLERGAKKVVAYAVHPVLSGPAIERIRKSNISRLVVTDTIPLTVKQQKELGDKLQIVSAGWLFGEAVRRIHHSQSLSSLFA